MKRSSKAKPDYLYKQLSDKLRADILAGIYQPEERLPSMDDFARMQGVNRITVKRALSELRAEGLIYSVPAQGTFVSPRTDKLPLSATGRLTLGLVFFGLPTHQFSSYHVDVITGIQEALARREWNLVLISLNEPSEDRAYEHVMQTQLDGAVYLGNFEASLIRRLARNGPPSVLIDQKLHGVRCDTININNHDGAYEATQHLIELGHRRIAVITGFDGHISQERTQGVLDAWAEAGLPPSDIAWHLGNFHRESGHAAARKILAAKRIPTAIFPFNDEMAAGVMQAIHEQGKYRIPDDISVIGFDNINWALATYPQLTTMQVERFAMGALAVDRLEARIRDQRHTPTSTLVNTRLIVRQSTGPAPTR